MGLIVRVREIEDKSSERSPLILMMVWIHRGVLKTQRRQFNARRSTV